MKPIQMAGSWITDLEKKTVADMMDNGWDNYDYVEKFEQAFAKWHDRKYCLMTPCCTHAIHLLLLALGIKERDEVIVPEPFYANYNGFSISAGVNISFAPSSINIFLLSTDIDSGIVKISLYPLAAQTNAKPIPVFPEVGSIIVVFLLIKPSFSAFSTIAKPILSFTEDVGLKNSSLHIISPKQLYFSDILGILIKGVFPIVSKILLYILFLMVFIFFIN